MRRVTDIRRAGAWDTAGTIDRVVLDSADRHRRRVVLTGEHGTRLLVDWPQPVKLKDGDGLLLDDGTMVQVVAEPELLVEIGATTPLELTRLAWHLGNRHTDVQIAGDRLRIRRDHVLEDMVARLGATISPIEAPFDPETGATHGHGHGA